LKASKITKNTTIETPRLPLQDIALIWVAVYASEAFHHRPPLGGGFRFFGGFGHGFQLACSTGSEALGGVLEYKKPMPSHYYMLFCRTARSQEIIAAFSCVNHIFSCKKDWTTLRIF
jgi:hypothetical protein